MSKEKLLIIGAGGLGRVVLEHAINKYNCSFIDDNCVDDCVCGHKVVGKVKDLSRYKDEYKNAIIAIGDNKTRQKIAEIAKMIGYNLINIYANNVYISPFSEVGKGCIFLNNVSVQNGSIVKDGVILCHGVEVHHDSYVGNYVLIYTNSVIRTYARVNDGAKIGSNCTVKNESIIQNEFIVDDGMVI